MAALPPEILEFLKRQSMPPPPSATPDIAPPPDPQGAPPPPPSAPADPMSPPPSQLEQLMAAYQRFGTDYSPDRLAAAQGRDRAAIESHRFAENMGNATGLMINNPGSVKFAAAVPLEVQNFLQRRDLAKEQIGQQTQILQMSPGSPLFRAKLEGARRAGIDVSGVSSPMELDALLAGQKGGGEAQEPGAKVSGLNATTAATLTGIPKTQEEAKALEVGNSPVPASTIAELAKKGIKVPAGTTMAQLEKITGPQSTIREGDAGRANALRLKQMEIDQWRAQNLATHPKAIAPGANYVGPKLFPDKEDTEPFYAVYTPGIETIKNLDAYGKHWELAAKDPTLLADPGWRQKTATLYESTFPAIAKKNAGGNSAPIADIDAAQKALADPGVTSQALGTALPKVRASVKTLRRITARDIEEVGKAHFIDTNLHEAGASDPSAIAHYKASLKPGERLFMSNAGDAKALGQNDTPPEGFHEVR